MSSNARGRKRTNGLAEGIRARWLPILLFILVAVFIGQNRERVSIDLFWAHLVWPLWFVLLLTAVVGLLIGALGMRRKLRRPQ